MLDYLWTIEIHAKIFVVLFESNKYMHALTSFYLIK